MSPLRLLRDPADAQPMRAQLDAGLRTFNDEQSHWHRDIRQTGGAGVDLYYLAEDGTVVAGLYGEIYWQSLEIDRLWVHPDWRGQGLGRQLLAAAESQAIAAQCRFIHLTTFSFQAPALYQRHGYEVCGELKDFPPGFSKYWLRRTLTA